MITSMGTIDICLSAASSCIAKSSEGVTTRRRRRRRPGATGALAATSVFLTGLPDFGHSYAISSSSSSTRGAHAAFGATTTTTLQRAKTSLDLGDHLFGGGILVRGPGTRPRGRDTPCRWRAASLVYCNCFCRPGDTSSELSFAFARGGRAGIGNAGRPSCTMPLLCSFVEQDAAMLEEVVETGWQLDDIDTEAIGIGSQGLFLTPIPHAAGVAAAAPLEESAAVSRRQRSELESQWLEDLGQDVPFQFADMQQAMELPCNIQLVPRVERKSLVYVNGTDAGSRKDTVTAATPEIVSKAAKIRSSSRVASLGGSVAAAAAAVTAAVVTIRAEETVGQRGSGGLTRGELDAQRRSKGEPSNGDTIRLVGEMDISKPGYLKVQEGKDGRSDTLLVSQFGLTRGGAVSRLDLDPPPRLPRLFGAEGVAGAGAGAGGLFVGRTQPRLTGTWTSPLVWPNEVNEVPPAAVVRLTKGEDAESRYRAAMKKRKQYNDDDGGGGGGGGGEERGGLDPKKKAPLLRLEAGQFNLLRLESDKFVNGDDDIYTRPTMRPRGEPHAVVAEGGIARVEGGTTKGEDDEDPSGWEGPLPEQAVLVADGFLVPGKSDGGVYIVVPHGDGRRKRRDGAARTEESGDRQSGGGVGGERIIRLTSAKRGWFYHKAVWLVLPGGKKVVLTARVHKPLFGPAEGELVLLEMPQVDSPLAEHNLPWREKVLVTGPDVMFEVVDLDPKDCTVQVICAEFFGGKLTMHSLWGGGSLPGSRPSVTESWVLDYNAGPAYSVTAADLRGGSPGGRPTHFLVTTHESSYDYSLFTHANAARSRGSRLPFEFDSGAGSASASDSESGSIPGSVSARGQAGSRGDASAWGGVVTGVEERRRWERCVEGTGSSAGGALLAYEIPEDWRVFPRIYPSPGWNRVTLASGFRVRGLSINPGTPGFPYVFHPHKSMEGKQAPYIAVAGDCSQSAYILRPVGADGRLPLESELDPPSALKEEASSATQEVETTPFRADELAASDDGAPALVLDEGEASAGRTGSAINPSSAAAAGGGGGDGAGAGAGGAAGPALAAVPNPKPEANAKELKPIAYEVACAIVVPGTVGSLAVSYGPFLRGSGAAGTVTPVSSPASTGFPRYTDRRRPNGVEGEHVIPPEFLSPGERSGLSEGRLGQAGEGGGTGKLRDFSASAGGSVGDVGSDGGGGGGDGGDGWAKLFVPNYNGNKVYVFSMEPAASLV